MLSENDMTRYGRQMMIPGLGPEGQARLKAAHVVVAGVGGLGCPCAVYLVAAGIGRVTLIDSDCPELSNLNRQILHWQEDIGRPKVDSARQKLNHLNPNVEIVPRAERITPETVDRLLAQADAVVDCMDNFATRFILNAACVRARVPFIHGSIYGLEGRLTTILPGKTPCLSCIYPTDPIEVKPFPVLGATPGIVACLQAMEVIKLLTGIGQPLAGRMFFFDGSAMTFHAFAVPRNPTCAVCGSV